MNRNIFRDLICSVFHIKETFRSSDCRKYMQYILSLDEVVHMLINISEDLECSVYRMMTC